MQPEHIPEEACNTPDTASPRPSPKGEGGKKQPLPNPLRKERENN